MYYNIPNIFIRKNNFQFQFQFSDDLNIFFPGLVDPLESNREHGGNNATATTTMTYSRIANTNLVPLYPPDGSADFQRQ